MNLKLNADWYKTFNLGLFLKYPHDYLGDFAAEMVGNGKNNPTAYFPTPMNVCVMIAKMTMIDANKTSSVCDPCVGSGRLLMVASNYSINIYGMDIDFRILQICKANMWMYVPWGVVKFEIEGLESRGKPIERGDALAPVQATTKEVQKKLLKEGGQMALF